MMLRLVVSPETPGGMPGGLEGGGEPGGGLIEDEGDTDQRKDIGALGIVTSLPLDVYDSAAWTVTVKLPTAEGLIVPKITPLASITRPWGKPVAVKEPGSASSAAMARRTLCPAALVWTPG